MRHLIYTTYGSLCYKVVHEYIGKHKPVSLMKCIAERNVLKKELKKVNEALATLKKIERR